MNLQTERIARQCEQLKLDTMNNEWPAIAQTCVEQGQSVADFLEQSLQVELNARATRTQSILHKFAGLPAIKTVEQYDFKFATGAPKRQIQELTSLAFIERKENVVLLGPSGVGKTETALALAEQVYGSEEQLTVINMSEFKEEHKVSLLLGSPPGYVGYGQGGILTEAVRKRPYSVVLLDEGNEIGFYDGLARQRFNQRGDGLSKTLIGNADYCSIGDGGMKFECLFNFLWIHLFATSVNALAAAA